jgi:pimeloyl-ACP methyl ester carboxylesterase
MMRRSLKLVFGSYFLLLLTACYLTKSAQVPMPTLHYPAASGHADGLMILLPGFGDSPERFMQQGLIDIVRQLTPTFDIVAVDAHFAYYRNQSLVTRLHTDLLGPRQDRYQRIWVVGISMGGLGASSYAMEHPGVVERVILLAPYMGNDDLVSEVKASGGIAQWEPPDFSNIENEEQRQFYRIWNWYKGYTRPDPTGPDLMLGFGMDDNLSDANQLLADALPHERVVRTPGGHKWKVWVPIFETLLRRSIEDTHQGET